MADIEVIEWKDMGAYFVKKLIDTYGPKLIDTALTVFQETVGLLKTGMTQSINSYESIICTNAFLDLLHGGDYQNITTAQMASMQDMSPSTITDPLLQCWGLNRDQIKIAQLWRSVVDKSLNQGYPLGWSGQRWVFYNSRDKTLFPKLISDAVYEKALGYGDQLLKGAVLTGVSTGIKTLVEATRIGTEAGMNLANIKSKIATIPLPTSEGATQ